MTYPSTSNIYQFLNPRFICIIITPVRTSVPHIQQIITKPFIELVLSVVVALSMSLRSLHSFSSPCLVELVHLVRNPHLLAESEVLHRHHMYTSRRNSSSCSLCRASLESTQSPWCHVINALEYYLARSISIHSMCAHSPPSARHQA